MLKMESWIFKEKLNVEWKVEYVEQNVDITLKTKVENIEQKTEYWIQELSIQWDELNIATNGLTCSHKP